MMPARFGSRRETGIEERMHREYVIAAVRPVANPTLPGIVKAQAGSAGRRAEQGSAGTPGPGASNTEETSG